MTRYTIIFFLGLREREWSKVGLELSVSQVLILRLNYYAKMVLWFTGECTSLDSIWQNRLLILPPTKGGRECVRSQLLFLDFGNTMAFLYVWTITDKEASPWQGGGHLLKSSRRWVWCAWSPISFVHLHVVCMYHRRGLWVQPCLCHLKDFYVQMWIFLNPA